MMSSAPQIKLDFLSSKTKFDPKDGYKFREYEIKVNYRDKTYIITKKINLFLTLYDNLEQHFPGIQLPQVPDVFESLPEDRALLKEEGVYGYDYSGSMKELLTFFCNHPLVRETVFLKKLNMICYISHHQ